MLASWSGAAGDAAGSAGDSGGHCDQVAVRAVTYRRVYQYPASIVACTNHGGPVPATRDRSYGRRAAAHAAPGVIDHVAAGDFNGQVLRPGGDIQTPEKCCSASLEKRLRPLSFSQLQEPVMGESTTKSTFLWQEASASRSQ